MVKTVLLIALFAFTFTALQAQTHHRVKNLGIDWFGSRIFPSGTGSWIVTDNPGLNATPKFWRLQDRWHLEPMSSNSLMPFKAEHTKTIAFSDRQGWVGAIDKVAYTTDYSTWTEIDISEPGREVNIAALSLYEGGIGVLASLWSYVITRHDTAGPGPPIKWVDEVRNSVVLIQPTSRTVLYLDSNSSRHPLTNVVQYDSESFVVGFRSGLYAMAILGLDSSIRYVNRPQGTTAGSALYLHGTTNNDFYCFYGPAYSPTGGYIPSAVVYHATSETSEYIDLSEIGSVNQATSSEGLVVGSVNGGLAIIQGSSARFFPIQDTSYDTSGNVYPYAMHVYGAEFVNRDTLICNSQSRLVVIPRQLLMPTSVEAPSPGRTLGAASSSHLVDIVDGSQEVVWSVFDNTGRAVLAGTMSVGQRDLRLPLEGVSSGVYHLVLTGDGRVIRTQTLLKSP